MAVNNRPVSKYDLGYCTNVHAGEDLDRYLESLDRHAVGVRSRLVRKTPSSARGRAILSPAKDGEAGDDGFIVDAAGCSQVEKGPHEARSSSSTEPRLPSDQPLPIGLWLSARTARQILAENRLQAFGEFLTCRGLRAFTMNGFPYGDFHATTVKYQVYRPDWTQAARYDYTVDLINILTGLMPEGAEAGISTLPLGWPGDAFDNAGAVDNLMHIVDLLKRTEQQTGKRIHLDLEPEPGCLLGRSRDVVSFFENHLLPGHDESDVLQYLRVCHDICHASVMFEDQQAAMAGYAARGIQIGKVHVSSAIEAEINAGSCDVLDQLRAFQEDRYLHQTTIRQSGNTVLYDDLPQAITALDAGQTGQLRCHFHVPVFIKTFGSLRTTQQDIVDCLDSIYAMSDCRHFEVETYAWTVLPDALQVDDLAQGIAQELLWVQEALEKCSHAHA